MNQLSSVYTKNISLIIVSTNKYTKSRKDPQHMKLLLCCCSTSTVKQLRSCRDSQLTTLFLGRLRGLSLPRESVVRLTDRPDIPIVVYRGHTVMKQMV